MHRRNICHRDLCLRNMVLSYKDNAVVIADLASPRLLLCSACNADDAPCARNYLFSGEYVGVWAALHVCQHLLTKAQDADQLQAYIDLLGPAENTWPTVTEMRL